ncbi:MAG: hypothetical protein LBH75_08370 [Treponema sp.]|nr:hypothetical protein [Treponema sp.]
MKTRMQTDGTDKQRLILKARVLSITGDSNTLLNNAAFYVYQKCSDDQPEWSHIPPKNV